MYKIALVSLTLAALLQNSQQGITMDTGVHHHHKGDSIAANDHITVHLVPHTHDDVGWLKTPDEYFSGAKMDTQKAGVELILETVIRELIANPDRKFSYVEMKFFSMWWYEQTDDMKAQVKKLVQDGRLEFLNAGWSMADEACPYHEDMINNMMHGHQFLLKEFGVKPRVGWHIDPFGHSSATPRLFAEMGFDAWFFSRLDYQDKERRLDAQEMEWLWRPFFEHQGTRTQIFTHAMYHHYSAPDGFNFDTTGDDQPMVDDQSLSTYNIDDRVSAFRDWVVEQSLHFKNSSNLFVVMGDDFQYQNARQNFLSLDKLIKYFNLKYSDMTLQYSTPSIYLNAIAAKNIEWPTKYDDMFPYADNEHSFWTGYFTSRANAKAYIRRGSSLLHASTKLYSLQVIDQTTSDQRIVDILAAKNKFMDVMGVLQHHDAVTGTAKQAVAENYNSRLHRGMEFNNKVYSQVVGEALKKLIPGLTAKTTEWQWCQAENSTYLDCPIAETNLTTKMIVAAFNPSVKPTEYISIAVPSSTYTLKAYNFTSKALYTPNTVVFCENELLPNNYTVNNCWMHVELRIEAQQYGVLTVVYNATNDLLAAFSSEGTPVIENDFEKLTLSEMFANESGQKFMLEKKMYNQSFNFSFDLRYWSAFQSILDEQHSGAYIFRAQDDTYNASYRYSNLTAVEFVQTSVVSQMTLNYSNNDQNESAVIKVRLFKKNPAIEWNVKLFGIYHKERNSHGKEVTLNFHLDNVDNNKTFYTDSNGLEMQERILDYRPTWNFTSVVNITQNYYPVNSAITLKDVANGNQMLLMTPRSLGGSSLYPGTVEFMHNRRLYQDDQRGVGEELNEVDIFGNGITVVTTYHLQIFNSTQESSFQRTQQHHIEDPLQYLFNFNSNLTTSAVSAEEQDSKFLAHDEEVITAQRLFNTEELKVLGLPETAKIQMFPMAKNSILIRITNLADKFDLGSNPTTPYVKIDDLALQLYQLANGPNSKPLQTIISETSLTANQLYTQMKASKTNWIGVDDDDITPPTLPSDNGPYNLALEPQRIRTFQVLYVPPQSMSIESQF